MSHTDAQNMSHTDAHSKKHIMTRAEIEADLLDGDDVSDWSDDTDDDTNN